jgi:hypothetical protein
MRPALDGNEGVELSIRRALDFQRVKEQRDELAIASHRGKPLFQVPQETGKRRGIDATCLDTCYHVIQQRVDRTILRFGCARSGKQSRKGLLDRQQSEREIHQGVQFLDLGFKDGDAVLRIINHAVFSARPRAFNFSNQLCEVRFRLRASRFASRYGVTSRGCGAWA